LVDIENLILVNYIKPSLPTQTLRRAQGKPRAALDRLKRWAYNRIERNRKEVAKMTVTEIVSLIFFVVVVMPMVALGFIKAELETRSAEKIWKGLQDKLEKVRQAHTGSRN
jgi:hypothetical protein